jgi:sortase B
MHTPDGQEYYLHRDFEGQYSAAGTLFAADISDVDRPTDAIIVYGHMMKSGTMFGDLKRYTEKGFWEKHRSVRLDTLSESRSYEIFCVFRTAVDTGREDEFRYYDISDFADAAAFEEMLARAQNLQYYNTGITPPFGSKILILSTCEYSQKNGRLVVLAVESQ